MTAAPTTAAGVTLPAAITPAANRRRVDLAQEVIDLLTVALARDDRRRYRRCPRCGRRLDEELS